MHFGISNSEAISTIHFVHKWKYLFLYMSKLMHFGISNSEAVSTILFVRRERLAFWDLDD